MSHTQTQTQQNPNIPKTLFKYTSRKHASRLNALLSTPRIQNNSSSLYSKMLKRLENEKRNHDDDQMRYEEDMRRKERVEEARRVRNMKREKRRVLGNVKAIRERRHAVEQDYGIEEESEKDQEGGNHGMRKQQHESCRYSSSARRHRADSHTSTQHRKQHNHKDTTPQSFIGSIIEKSQQSTPNNKTLQQVSSIHSESSSLRGHAEHVDDKHDTQNDTDSLPSFKEWFKKQKSQKSIVQGSPKGYDEWKQKRPQIRNELDACRKDLDDIQTNTSNRLQRQASVRSIQSSSPASPVSEGSPVLRVSHNIYERSESSPSRDTRKSRPWKSRLERSDSVSNRSSKHGSAHVSIPVHSSISIPSLTRQEQGDAHDDEDTTSDDTISVSEPLQYDSDDPHEQEFRDLDQKLSIIKSNKSNVMQNLNHGSSDDLHRDLSSLRRLSVNNVGE